MLLQRQAKQPQHSHHKQDKQQQKQPNPGNKNAATSKRNLRSHSATIFPPEPVESFFEKSSDCVHQHVQSSNAEDNSDSDSDSDSSSAHSDDASSKGRTSDSGE